MANGHAEAIVIFRGGADGEEPPIRIIQGPKTLLDGVDRLDVDVVHDEIFVPAKRGGQILVFPRKAAGDVAPVRVIEGPDTQLRGSGAVAVDPVNNLLVVGLTVSQRTRTGGLVTFSRTANGNAKPVGVIRGPKSGIIRINQMETYPPRRLVIATQPGELDDMEPEGAFVGVWSVDDNGDVPPRWKLAAGPKSTLKKPRGVVLDPKNKELIIADMRLNAVLTFYFPEIF